MLRKEECSMNLIDGIKLIAILSCEIITKSENRTYFSMHSYERRFKEIIKIYDPIVAREADRTLISEYNNSKASIEICFKKFTTISKNIVNTLDFAAMCTYLINRNDRENLSGLIDLGKSFGVKGKGVFYALQEVLEDLKGWLIKLKSKLGQIGFEYEYRDSTDMLIHIKNKECIQLVCDAVFHPGLSLAPYQFNTSAVDTLSAVDMLSIDQVEDLISHVSMASKSASDYARASASVTTSNITTHPQIAINKARKKSKKIGYLPESFFPKVVERSSSGQSEYDLDSRFITNNNKFRRELPNIIVKDDLTILARYMDFVSGDDVGLALLSAAIKCLTDLRCFAFLLLYTKALNKVDIMYASPVTGKIAMHVAIATGNVAAVKLLLDAKSNPSPHLLSQLLVMDYSLKSPIDLLNDIPDNGVKLKICKLIHCALGNYNEMPSLMLSDKETHFIIENMATFLCENFLSSVAVEKMGISADVSRSNVNGLKL